MVITAVILVNIVGQLVAVVLVALVVMVAVVVVLAGALYTSYRYIHNAIVRIVALIKFFPGGVDCGGIDGGGSGDCGSLFGGGVDSL